MAHILLKCVFVTCTFLWATSAVPNPIRDLLTSAGIIKNPELFKIPNSNVIVTLKDPLQHILHPYFQKAFPSRSEKIASLVRELRAFSLMSQAPLLALIRRFTGVEATPLWISNQLSIKNATPSFIKALANSQLVKNIARDLLIPIMPILNMTLGTPPEGPEWGIRKINGDKLWNLTKGEGIIVGTIDTGARHTHSALKNNYVGRENYGWYDPILYTDEPYDPAGHGTHTTATIAGDNGIGIAPKAKWMACKGCGILSCFPSALLACGQFMLCPTDTDGNHPDCSKAPHIVSNSWGGGGEDDFFNPVIASWRAVGIIPFFAIGNEGPECESTSVPANQKDVISVGATDNNDRLATFSSRGPYSNSTLVKPELLAPGKDINSAWFLNDNSYKVLSETSMATPLVAGAAALLLSLNSSLKYDDIRDLFYETTFRGISNDDGITCGNISRNVYPNHLFGYGRIDVLEAYIKMIEGTVYQPKKQDSLNLTDSDPLPRFTLTFTLPKLF